MKTLRILLGLVFALCCLSAYADNNTTPSILGYWQQINDANNQPQSIMYLSLDKNNQLVGKVVTGFLVNGKPPQSTCANCPSPFTNKPILGMQILWGFTQSNDTQWAGGHILDPDKASIYRCTLTLQNDGKDLKVHGYIGIPLLGRTQIWHRLTQQQAFTLSKTAYQTILNVSS